MAERVDIGEEQEEGKPKTPREIALDTMCSTLKVAYRDWNRKQEEERKTA
ncbi:hypothetical protein [Paratractidigestivibacter sp.]|nr:hypothetical protein [Paratractidigestivibacter sp.]